jgi:hypothetical protein
MPISEDVISDESVAISKGAKKADAGATRVRVRFSEVNGARLAEDDRHGRNLDTVLGRATAWLTEY